MKRLGRNLLIAANVVCLTPLFLAMLAPYVNVERWWLPSVCALLYPWVLLLPLVCCIPWVFFARVMLVFNLGVLALNFNHIAATYQINSQGGADPRDVRVVSMNVDAFRFKSENVRTVANLLLKQKPDILCLQEFRSELSEGPPPLPYFKEKLGLAHHAFVPLSPGKAFGLIIFSRYPIVRTNVLGDTSRHSGNGLMFADLVLYGETLRVYNMHLESYSFSVSQKRMLGQAQTPARARKENGKRRKVSSDELNSRNVWEVVKVMLGAWRNQLKQLAAYRRHKQNAPRAVIVCGDLNNTPHTYMYRKMTEEMQDCFREAGNGFGKTYGSGPKALRIDYILASNRLKVSRFRTLETQVVSDHKANYAQLRFNFHK